MFDLFFDFYIFDGEGASGEGDAGENVQSDAEDYDGNGQQTAENTDEKPTDPDAEFDEAIRGKYKTQYEKKLKSDLSRRMRGSNKAKEERDAMRPIVDRLMARYDAKDLADLESKLRDDEGYYERAAYDQNATDEMIRRQEELKMQVIANNRKEAAESRQRQLDAWMNEAPTVQEVYPNFDLLSELESNEKFFKYLNSGDYSMLEAYQAANLDGIMKGAIAQARREGAAERDAALRSQKSRPRENGMTGGAPGKTGRDISSLTKAECEELEARAARGERITLK